MSIQITETVAVRLWALLWLACTAGGSISALILTQYPADQHPAAKLVALVFAVAGLLASVAQAQSKPAFHSEGGGPRAPFAPVLLAACLLLAALPSAACDKSKLQKAADTSDRVVELCDKGERVIAELKAGALIDPEDADRLAPLVSDVRAAAAELGSVARSLKGDEPDAKARVRAAVVALASAADRLEAEGILRVKNERTRAKLRKALAVARVGAELGL